MGVAAHLPGTSAGAVIAEAVTLQLLVIASLEQLGHAEEGLDLTAQKLLTDYTNRILSTRLDVSKLSGRIAEGIEAEVVERAQAMVVEAEALWQEGARKALDEMEARTEARAVEMAEAAVPHHVAKALELLGVPADVAEDGQLNLGQPQPVAEA